MSPLIGSFVMQRFGQLQVSREATKIFALLPPSSTAVTAVPTESSVPFTLMAAFAIAISYADRSNLSTAIIPMAAAFNWDSLFSGLVLSSFWAGYALTQILGGRLGDKYGGERLLIIAMMIWSTCTALTPAAASLGNVPIIAIRVLLGAGEGLALPAIHSMIQKYVMSTERATSASIVTAACYLGALLSNLLSPLIISQAGWEACFIYFAAVPPLIWLPLWALIFGRKGFGLDAQNTESAVNINLLGDKADTNEINEETLLTNMDDFEADVEKAVTLEMKSILNESEVHSPMHVTEPQSLKADHDSEAESVTSIGREEVAQTLSLRTLLSSPPVWAIICAQYGQSWGSIGLLSWLPTYYNQRFGVPLESLSNFTVLPYFLQMVVAVSSGFLADRLVMTGMRTLLVRQVLQITGMIVPAVCLAYCAYSPALEANDAAALITFGSAVSAITVAAVSVNQFDISPKNAGTIFGIGNTAGCVAGLIAVPISGYIFDQTHNWDAVFLLFAFHYLGGALLWGLWASDQPLKGPQDTLQDQTVSPNSF